MERRREVMGRWAKDGSEAEGASSEAMPDARGRGELALDGEA